MKKSENKKARFLTAVVASPEGEIFELDGYAAVGMAGNLRVPLSVEETIPLPYGTELMFLPDRNPIMYNLLTRKIETLAENPYRPGETIFPVALSLWKNTQCISPELWTYRCWA